MNKPKRLKRKENRKIRKYQNNKRIKRKNRSKKQINKLIYLKKK